MTAKPAVFVLDPYHKDAIAALQGSSDIELVLPHDPKKNSYRENANVVLVRSDTRITATDLNQCRQLKCIVKQGAGVDNVDLEAAKAGGIKVYNTPGINSETVAELTLSLTLCLSRRVAEIDRRVRQGEKVIRSQMLGKSLHKKVLGVIGMGHIGLALARKWMGAMEGSVVGFDPFYPSDGGPWTSLSPGQFQRVESMDELLKISDVISLHVPLTPSTRDCIAAREFGLMKEGVILLNCARGGVVNENALLDALESGKLFGAGLDATVVEPPTREQYGSLLEMENVIITPHIGASTAENQSQSGLAAVEVALGQARGIECGNRVA